MGRDDIAPDARTDVDARPCGSQRRRRRCSRWSAELAEAIGRADPDHMLGEVGGPDRAEWIDSRITAKRDVAVFAAQRDVIGEAILPAGADRVTVRRQRRFLHGERGASAEDHVVEVPVVDPHLAVAGEAIEQDIGRHQKSCTAADRPALVQRRQRSAQALAKKSARRTGRRSLARPIVIDETADHYPRRNLDVKSGESRQPEIGALQAVEIEQVRAAADRCQV